MKNNIFQSDYCFTGSYWDVPREAIEWLEPEKLSYKFNLYGGNWEKISELNKYYQGFIDYEKIPLIYASTKLVIDDSTMPSKKYGSVNSRIFDALAAGTLIITNGKLGSIETFHGKLPYFTNATELNEQIEYYLSNKKIREAKIEELQDMVLREHTYDIRAQKLQNTLKKYATHTTKTPLFFLKKSKLNPKKAYIYYKAYTKINKLNLFDEEFYKETYPQLAETHMDLLIHYLFHGYKEKKLPSKYFDGNFYLNKYPNVKKSGMNPLVHYVLYGIHENKRINIGDDGFITDFNECVYAQYEEGIHKKITKELSLNNYITRPDISVPYIESEKGEYPLDTIKVAIFLHTNFNRMDGCSSIRLGIPLKELSIRGKYHFFIYDRNTYNKFNYENIIKHKCFDVLIFQRHVMGLNITKIFNQAEVYGIKTIHEFDDEFNVDETHRYYMGFQKWKKQLDILNEKSDRIIVSTPELVKRYNKKENVELIRNYCIPDLSPSEKIVTIGYFGTITHKEDLLLIKDAIITLKNKLRNKGIIIKFEIIGVTNNPSNWYTAIKVPHDKTNFTEFIPWLKKTVEWDIGVAPLEDTYFNKAKSELKYIEYTALGVPTVCSDIESYNAVIKDGINGFLAKNTEEWVEKLEKLIMNKDLREKIYNNAIKDINTNYNLEDRVKQWDNILMNLSKESP